MKRRERGRETSDIVVSEKHRFVAGIEPASWVRALTRN